MDFICCTASSRSLVSSTDLWGGGLGGLVGGLLREVPFIWIGRSVTGEEGADMGEIVGRGSLRGMRGGVSSQWVMS